MFIRKTKTGTAKDGSPRFSFRLVRNDRVEGKVKQRTLMNLGRHFRIEQHCWSLLCQRIEELLSAQHPFDFVPPAPNIEAEARRIANQLLARNAESLPATRAAKDWQTVNVNSASDSDVRSVGVEHAALEALNCLGVPELLLQLGFNRRQRCCALASIVARMAAPASERRTNLWLRNTSAVGEMLGLDFGALSDMALYRISDRLFAKQEQIEQHLYARVCTLFSLKPTIAFYDLTNTYFEGKMLALPQAQRGRSKEKRSDCPLLTLALVVDASGFVMKSHVFAGNIAECKTLEKMLDQLGANEDATVVMDRGLAAEDNLHWLREHGYRYVVVSRQSKREFDRTAAIETLHNALNQEVSFYQETAKQVDEHGNCYQESHLRCYSQARADKENSIVGSFMKRFEKGLEKINEALSKPKARRQLQQVERRLGRLQKQNSRVARHYQVQVHADESGTRAQRISWRFEPIDGTMVTHPGVYCLRSNILDWDGHTMWRTYMTLTEVESVFRCLKSELGLRPVFHQKPRRAKGHLLISVLAYQAVCLLRTRLKSKGYHDSWTTLRHHLSTITRTTTTFERRDGRTLHVRKTVGADADQAAIYDAMGIVVPPRNLQKTIV